jgi:hypothetical protein
VQDLGVQSAYYRDPARMRAWERIGQYVAERRAKAAVRKAAPS